MTQASPLPDEKIMCHRTGFTKTCFECVTTHKCRLWKRVTLEGHPETGAAVDLYDCVDSLVDLYSKDMLRRQLQTTATVDKLSKEVRESNAGAMGALLGSVNQQLRALGQLPQPEQPALTNGAHEPKLLEG